MEEVVSRQSVLYSPGICVCVSHVSLSADPSLVFHPLLDSPVVILVRMVAVPVAPVWSFLFGMLLFGLLLTHCVALSCPGLLWLGLRCPALPCMVGLGEKVIAHLIGLELSGDPELTLRAATARALSR